MLPTKNLTKAKKEAMTSLELFVCQITIDCNNARRVVRGDHYRGDAVKSSKLLRNLLRQLDRAEKVSRVFERVYLSLTQGYFYHVSEYEGPYGRKFAASTVPNLDTSVGNNSAAAPGFVSKVDSRDANETTFKEWQETLFSMFKKNENKVAVMCHDPQFMAVVHESREGYQKMTPSVSINVDKRWTISKHHTWYKRTQDGGNIPAFMIDDANLALDKILLRLERYRMAGDHKEPSNFIMCLWATVCNVTLRLRAAISRVEAAILDHAASTISPEFATANMLSSKDRAVLARYGKGVTLYKGAKPVRYHDVARLDLENEKVIFAHRAGQLTYSMPQLYLRVNATAYDGATEFDMTDRWLEGQRVSGKVKAYMKRKGVKM